LSFVSLGWSRIKNNLQLTGKFRSSLTSSQVAFTIRSKDPHAAPSRSGCRLMVFLKQINACLLLGRLYSIYSC